MTKIFATLSALILLHVCYAQTSSQPIGTHYPNGVYYAPCSSFQISKPFKQLAADQPAIVGDRFDKEEVDGPRKPHHPNASGLPLGEDPARQAVNGKAPLTAPIQNWTGQRGNGAPLDPTGAAGLTAYVQAVNTSYRAYNKNSGAPLMGSLSLKTLWPGSTNAGDPVVLYDKYADRWFIQQFNFDAARQNPLKILIAISTTNDPTGTYYQYTFTPDPNGGPDYPKFAIWPDGYYMTANWFDPNASVSAVKQQVTVFDRTKMLAGNSTAGMVSLPLRGLAVDTTAFFTPIFADADGSLPPYGTPASLFYFEDDNWAGPTAPKVSKDQIHILKMTTDWTTPSNTNIVEDIAGGSPLPTQPFNAAWPANGYEISQKGDTTHLDAIAGIFMFRAQYRKWPSYNTLLLNHAVKVNSTGQSGVRWYELRQDANSGMWSIYQQSTFAPDAENRWMASLAMDDNGNIGMAYCISGANTYPSLGYTGRYNNDPLNTMTCAEIVAMSGTGSQSGFDRWGDYGHTSLDPDGQTFWHTGMWESASAGQESQIFSFQISGSAGIAEHHSSGGFDVIQNGNGTLLVKGSGLASDASLVVDLFDIEGRQLNGQHIHPISNSFETTIPVGALPKGAYLVRIGNAGFQKVIKVVLN
jgi:hypothetical protein